MKTDAGKKHGHESSLGICLDNKGVMPELVMK